MSETEINFVESWTDEQVMLFLAPQLSVFTAPDATLAAVGEATRWTVAICHGIAKAAGWWVDPKTGAPITRPLGELLMLCVSEIAEGMEGHRKGLMDDKLPTRTMLEVELADCCIREFDMAGGLSWDTFPVNVAVAVLDARNGGLRTAQNVPTALLHICKDLARAEPPSARWLAASALVRCFLLGTALGLDVPGAIIDKLIFNRHRADHTLAARAAEGGKAY